MRIDLDTIDPALHAVAARLERLVRGAGGRVYLVGGSVRDALLGRRVTDLDLEVFGLEAGPLRSLLEREWAVDEVGESFAVLKLRHHRVDVSLPRRERATGSGHRDFEVAVDPWMSLAEAARRRDFTVNAIMAELPGGGLEDPFGGRADLELRVLRHTSQRFVEDPLRVLRGMQLVARFGLEPAPETVALCRRIPFAGLVPERVFEEWRKLLLQGAEISRGLAFLEACGWIRHFPELDRLRGCPQDPAWHPEGDVWVHTLHVMDVFASERVGEPWEDLVVGLACLCHDLGKPDTTSWDDDRIRSRGHEAAGEAPTRSFLGRMTRQTAVLEQVVPLVIHHLKPRQLWEARASDAAVRRLAQKVGRIDRLARVARADSGGRPPLPRSDDPSPEWLLERARALELADRRPRPLVLGRHLIQRGLEPGPAFGPLLDRCFEAQLDGAFLDLEGGLAWLDRLLAGRSADEAAAQAEPGRGPASPVTEIKGRPGSS